VEVAGLRVVGGKLGAGLVAQLLVLRLLGGHRNGKERRRRLRGSRRRGEVREEDTSGGGYGERPWAVATALFKGADG
jgi:hypothetical protein